MALGEGMKILCIKDHVHSCINDFRERIRAITNPSFAVGRFSHSANGAGSQLTHILICNTQYSHAYFPRRRVDVRASASSY